ncbi:NAD(P)/FAD-dependent oxidoreductase [Euzebya tangerina]|uniref:NAD(P)/FAD-dependent oxidoreductase n=1 Tax=Euzebya tangerina TaxID=591198 RepID=UPI000E311B6D|nr:FAD-dependent oxidoreductase [Euzebya tangerina]
MTPHIVVIGGGYAGVMAARSAADHGADVTIVDAVGNHEFLPRLATVAAGAGPVDDADAPLTELLHGISVMPETATAIDHHGRAVKTTNGALTYDALVVSVGASSTPPPIPGLAEWGWTLKSAEDARRLRDHLRGAERVVIVGAGSTGTQLAGELSAQRRDVVITLTEMTDRILPSLPRALAHRAQQILRSRGVVIRTGRALREAGPGGAVFDDEEEVAGTVVWTGGFMADGTELLPEAVTLDGRVVVDRCGQVGGHGPLFAAGDIAAHRGAGGRVLPQTAQVAVQAGALAGENAVRVAEGRAPRRKTLRHIGWVLPLGGGHAVGQVGPVSLADPLTSRLAPLLHDVIDLRHLFTVGGLPAVVGHRQQPLGWPPA